VTDTFTGLTIGSDGSIYASGEFYIDGALVTRDNLDPAGRLDGYFGCPTHIAKWDESNSAWSQLNYTGDTFIMTPPGTHSREWRCDYCGRPNGKHAETCKSCGGVRSFLYD